MKTILNLANSIKRVKIVEIEARDGLQNEKSLSISKRIDFINRLTDCGFKQIEAGLLVKLKSMENSDQVLNK